MGWGEVGQDACYRGILLQRRTTPSEEAAFPAASGVYSPAL